MKWLARYTISVAFVVVSTFAIWFVSAVAGALMAEDGGVVSHAAAMENAAFILAFIVAMLLSTRVDKWLERSRFIGKGDVG